MPIEAIFHVESAWVAGTDVCGRHAHIWLKLFEKSFVSRIERPMTLNFGMVLLKNSIPSLFIQMMTVG